MVEAWIYGMKNQYFGDLNDYRKYGLIRSLTGMGELSTAVCWMLTPNDGRTDGRYIRYLEEPSKWQVYDPGLYEALRNIVAVQGTRSVHGAEEAGLLPSARFFGNILSDDRKARRRFFDKFWQFAEGSDLLFFDPDNGLEVKSKPFGYKGSSKYLYWRELIRAFLRGYSILVYQHFPRVKRDQFVNQKAREIACQTGARKVISFRTPRVVFFLLLPEYPNVALERNIMKVSEDWGSQIQVQWYKLS
jgi:hypothetical protein